VPICEYIYIYTFSVTKCVNICRHRHMHTIYLIKKSQLKYYLSHVVECAKIRNHEKVLGPGVLNHASFCIVVQPFIS